MIYTHLSPKFPLRNWVSSKHCYILLTIAEKLGIVVLNHASSSFYTVINFEKEKIEDAFGFNVEVGAEDIRKIRNVLPHCVSRSS